MDFPPTKPPDDNLSHSFNYSTLAKDLTARVQSHAFSGLGHLTQQIAEIASAWPGQKLRIEVRAPKALVRGNGMERLVWMHRDERRASLKARGEGGDRVAGDLKAVIGREEGQPWFVLKHEYVFPSLRLACIIGLNPHERLEKQDVVFKIRFLMNNARYPLQTGPSMSPEREGTGEGSKLEIPWQTLVRYLAETIEGTSFQTIEALAAYVAEWVLKEGSWTEGEKGRLRDDGTGVEEGMRGLEHMQGVSVAVEKPFAVTFAGGAGVEVVHAKVRESIGDDDKRMSAGAAWMWCTQFQP